MSNKFSDSHQSKIFEESWGNLWDSLEAKIRQSQNATKFILKSIRMYQGSWWIDHIFDLICRSPANLENKSFGESWESKIFPKAHILTMLGEMDSRFYISRRHKLCGEINIFSWSFHVLAIFIGESTWISHVMFSLIITEMTYYVLRSLFDVMLWDQFCHIMWDVLSLSWYVFLWRSLRSYVQGILIATLCETMLCVTLRGSLLEWGFL